MSNFTSPADVTGKVSRCAESRHGSPGAWLWMLTDHWVPLTKTALPGVPSCTPFPAAAPDTMKRWANAAFFDFTVIVHEPCMVMAIFSFSSLNDFLKTSGSGQAWPPHRTPVARKRLIARRRCERSHSCRARKKEKMESMQVKQSNARNDTAFSSWHSELLRAADDPAFTSPRQEGGCDLPCSRASCRIVC